MGYDDSQSGHELSSKGIASCLHCQQLFLESLRCLKGAPIVCVMNSEDLCQEDTSLVKQTPGCNIFCTLPTCPHREHRGAMATNVPTRGLFVWQFQLRKPGTKVLHAPFHLGLFSRRCQLLYLGPSAYHAEALSF